MAIRHPDLLARHNVLLDDKSPEAAGTTCTITMPLDPANVHTRTFNRFVTIGFDSGETQVAAIANLTQVCEGLARLMVAIQDCFNESSPEEKIEAIALMNNLRPELRFNTNTTH